MKTFLEISITVNGNQRELLIPTLAELGCQGFQETDDSLLCYIDKSSWSDKQSQSLNAELKNILRIISVNTVIKFRDIVEENWNETWERTIKPIEIGNNLVIKPSWCDYENINNKIIIQIDPKMSFGTGYHETTRLTLRLLEKYVRVGCSVLDVGTGTGILAIAAVKLGAKYATGTDNDEWSINNANENIIVNQVEDKIEISNRGLSEFPDASYDVLTANLTLNTNIEFLDEFRRILRTNGILLLSGLLNKDKEEMIQHLMAKRFSIIEILTENDWIAIASQISL